MTPRQRIEELLLLSSRRAAIEVAGVAFLVALICWYFGVNFWHAVLLGCAITATALASLIGLSAISAPDLSWRPGKRARGGGARNDVARLSASLRGGWGYVAPTAVDELRQIARRRLAVEGLDLDDARQRPAIEGRIGGDAYRTLMGLQGRVPKLTELRTCLDRLDAINPTYYPAPQ